MFSTNSATGVRALLKMAGAFSAATKARSWASSQVAAPMGDPLLPEAGHPPGTQAAD
jgi:hypothetical protein